MWEVRQTSTLAVEPDALWDVVGTMEGVNAELMPWIRMSAPKEAAGFRIEDAPLGRLAFHSWIMLAGLLPFDRHALTLIEVEPKRRFLEASHSWLQRLWRHERTLEAVDGGCRISDVVSFIPNLKVMGSLVRPIVALIFAHRHRRLRRRFGQVQGHSPGK